ncbi:aldo/keto reductase [Agrobacterium vitis]|uniref:Aldo/keto reductase n=1 Tax=Agrobacterium vitis TaxID=373 RepID=A0A368NQE7_AGRVI|nr:aldo/keto reductase [Agrobacterium vitis]KAA3516813.1 aldo/keto reductase [Agrobacterium vitis]KAA3529578.1 aldo/keto reductase [Agrobacterium vitis]MCF1477427.1 aldo/keto reductase [Agrobacterium vitis]MUZ97152.1 aldo/keto reductase [Agrobacterium vitis]MVA28162.1 aldo/keto reductase [Agrobacterium vitis]
MADQSYISFSDGKSIPQVGLGVWQTPNSEAAPAVRSALSSGYRHIDTAAVYENEEGVGEGIRSSGIDRGDIFLTTKLWNNEQGFDNTLKAFDASLKRLGTDYVDLYLIHWPSPHRGLFVETWKAFIQLKEEGRARSIGVSNFYPEHLKTIIDETGVVPVINQIELHPDFQQKQAREFHQAHGIITQSWSPLGQGKLLDNPVIGKIAAKHGRTAAQIIIRWHIESGLVVIPKSVTPSRIEENFKVFDFSLDPEDMTEIAALDSSSTRIGPDPMTASF